MTELLDLSGGRRRVAIVTGSYGAGHDAAARELARVFTEAGCTVTLHDIAGLLPARLGPILRRAYYAQLRVRPDTWSTTLRQLEPGQPLHWLAVRFLGTSARAVSRAVAGADLVVATHPFAAQALGRARAKGRLRCPAVTYLTDASVHALWVHPDIDLHLAIHDIAAEQARTYGGHTTTVRPLVPPSLAAADAEQVVDPLIGTEIVGPRALVTGGSLGIGELEAAARDILATGVMTPVVVCGSNDALRERLQALPGVVALGWRDDVDALLATSDCVVQNAGGFTSLEALASGTPVLTYRPIPGHGLTNADHLDRAGLIPWVRTVDELAPALRAALGQPRVDRLPSGRSVLEVLAHQAVGLGAA